MPRNYCSVILVILFCIIFFSCNNAEDNAKLSGVVHINMDPKNIPADARLSDIVKNVRIVPLETNPSCFIESVSRVFFGDKYIVLSTRGSKFDLMLFTTDGKFVRKIGGQGKGPGEYISILEFSVFEDAELVYINNGLSGKLLGYSFDGNFVKAIDGIDYSSQAIQLSHNITAYACYHDYQIKIINSESDDTIKQLFKFPLNEYTPPSLKGTVHSGFYYTGNGQDTIWKIDPDTIRPIISMDFGDGYISFNDWMKERANWGNAEPGLVLQMGYVIYAAGYYHFTYELTDKQGIHQFYHALVNEKSSKSWHFAHSGESDDILFAGATDFRASTPSGELVAVVNANDLIEAIPLIEKNEDFEYSKDLINQIKTLSIENNEVMVLFELK